MTSEEIIQSCTSISEAIAERVAGEEQAVDLLDKITSLMGNSAENIRWAKKNLLDKQGEWIDKLRQNKAEPSITKIILEGKLAEEKSIYEFCERIDSALRHKADGLRTMISLWKEQLAKG